MNLSLHSTKSSVNQASDMLSAAFEKLGLPPDTTFDLKLAAQEAVVNAVEHGNLCDERKIISITCEAGEDAITVTVRDEGNGFNPHNVPDPTLPENILREHGRGIFLMRNLCDEVRYNAKGNEVTIVKKITPGTK